MKHVRKNEQDGDVASDTLPRISTIPYGTVALQIRFPRSRYPNTKGGVENDRKKNEHPFDQGQKWKIVDGKNVVLEHRRSTEKTCIGQQMDTHVGSNGNESAQRMETPDKELISLEERNRSSRCCVRTHKEISWSGGGV